MSEVCSGQDLPARAYRSTSKQTVEYGAATGELSEIHYDPVAYTALGADRPLLHGGLKAAWVVQAVAAWLGENAEIHELNLSYRGMDLVDEEYIITGSVVAVDRTKAGTVVECSVKGSTEGGKPTTEGTVVVRLGSA